jgi:hypothetical protein
MAEVMVQRQAVIQTHFNLQQHDLLCRADHDVVAPFILTRGPSVSTFAYDLETFFAVREKLEPWIERVSENRWELWYHNASDGNRFVGNAATASRCAALLAAECFAEFRIQPSADVFTPVQPFPFAWWAGGLEQDCV